MTETIITTSITLVDVLYNVLRFLFTAFFLGASFLFIYLGVFKYILTKSPNIGETNKMIFFIALALIFLAVAFFVPALIANFIISLRGEGEIKPLPRSGVILRPTGTYTPIQIPSPQQNGE